MEVSYIFSLGGKGCFILLPFRQVVFSYVLISDLPGRCASASWQNRSRAMPAVTLADGACPSDYFPCLRMSECFWNGSASGCMKAYLSKEPTPRKMFIKQTYSFCLETCPAVPVLNIKNKLELPRQKYNAQFNFDFPCSIV